MRLGSSHSEESKHKASKSHKGKIPWNKGKKMSKETRRKIEQSGTWFKKGRISPNKGKKPSEETRRKISEKLKGKFSGDKHPMKGKKHSESSISKMIESHKNISEETRRKISESNKGKIPWNKGKSGIYSDDIRLRMSTSKKGKIPWNKGKVGIYSESTLQKMSNAHENRSEETRRKISESNKGKLAWNKGKTGIYNEEIKKKLSEARMKQVFPLKDTKPERLTQEILTKAGIEFEKHKAIQIGNRYHQVDLLIKPNKVIEMYGTYHHAHPDFYPDDEVLRVKGHTRAAEIRKKDEHINRELMNLGFDVLIVWDKDLKNNLENTTDKILKFVL